MQTEYDIILAGESYHPRPKGKLRQFLTDLLGPENDLFYALGNGSTFTGFVATLTPEQTQKVQIHLTEYQNASMEPI